MTNWNKNILASALCLGCLCVGPSLFAVEPPKEEVKDKLTDAQTWQLTADKTYTSRFLDDGDKHGAIDVAGTAIDLQYTPEEGKKDPSLILNFQNDPSVVISGDNKAHIRAQGNNAVAVNLAGKVNFNLNASSGKVPTLYASVSDVAAGTAVCICPAENGHINISDASKLSSVVSYNKEGEEDVGNCGAAVIGKAAVADAAVLLRNQTLEVKSDGNKLSSNVYIKKQNSASAVAVGAAAFKGAQENSSAATYENVVLDLQGANNEYVATSKVDNSGQVASGVFGAVSSVGATNMNGHNVIKVGQNNTLAASSVTATGAASSVVVGATSSASGNANARVIEKNECEIASGSVISAYSRSNSVASAAAFGASSTGNNGTSQARSMQINLNGDQMIGVLAKGAANTESATNTRVDVFGADVTSKDEDADNSHGWRVGIYNNTSNSSIVNIFGAIGTVNFQNNEAEVTLESANDVNAFALGNDFQIYIGGKSIAKDDGSVDFASCGKPGIVNIFGNIAPARNVELSDINLGGVTVKRVKDSKLTVNNGYTVNVFGNIKNGALMNENGNLNVYGLLQNATITGGSVNAYNTAENVIVQDGTLCIRECENNGAKDIIENQIKNTLKIANDGQVCKISNIKYSDETSFYKKFKTKGNLLLSASYPETVIYVQTDKTDPSIRMNGAAGLQKVSGHILADAKDALGLNGGKFRFIDTAEADKKVADDKLGIMVVYCPNQTMQEMLGSSLAKFTAVPEHDGLYVCNDTSSLIANTLAADRKLYAKDYIGIGIMGEDQAKALSIPCDACKSVELSKIHIAVASMFRGAVASRLIDVKGNGNDPFITAVGGHVHQSELLGVKYSGDLYGVAGGVDKLFFIENHGYLRVGAMLGYIYGDIDFTDSAISSQTDKQDNYLGAIYGAYETFDAKNLKTDINLSLGFGYTEHELSRRDVWNYGYKSKMKSSNMFFSAEFIKNLYEVQGIQFGLWAKADYNHIRQKSYTERALNGGTCAQSVKKANFDFIDMTLGVNIEKEIQISSNSDRRLRVYMRAGWNCQPVHGHSTILASIHNQTNVMSTDFGSKNSAVFVAGCRQRIDANWDIFGEWNGSFNKKHSNNVITLGAGYTF
ncbi:MAG: autotransporter outer membrane beta-barrel domain-containing protein [Opitutales bacterium]|nr:autotransporter outer membrane beta-barrel domain-containing protein [Opitutales bacterium]